MGRQIEVLEITISSSTPHFIQENQIFGKTFFLEFEWVAREEFWLLHIGDERQEYLACGIRIQPRWPLYTYHEAEKSFSLMLLGKTSNQLLGRETLKQYFSLVAYEAL